MKAKDTSKIFADYPDVLTVEDLSKMLAVSTKTVYKLLKEKKIKSITIGRTYKIPKIYVMEYLQIIE
ncbi:MAG TPA: helix-turn-helix domain-containing protein [Candidatus Eisenbergiella merdavium]|uniref:Helix-turn-helix domain-containing protein n=1 Tax=Candidatus Eisenbergiella merdavium TaxID=2838551 RepID=A0A9D2NGF1_9FIRM|nr:helix-turn-helix domain-containing protein [Candidatus Eisenbergiella merdavium]